VNSTRGVETSSESNQGDIHERLQHIPNSSDHRPERGSGVGGGVGMGSGPIRDYTAIIEFHEGKVTSARYFDN
jgi:hypothetical protein